MPKKKDIKIDYSKMTVEELQNRVDETFTHNFGYTPFKERMNDIERECLELIKWTDIPNLREESGDALASIIKLCKESKWNFWELVMDTLDKINGRHEQYKSLGRKIKVAILGGAFNPIHNDHIGLAKFVLDTSGEFDEVWLLPAYHHMYNKDMVSEEHRLEMCRLAAECDRRIRVFDFEIKNKMAGETYNLFKRLKEEKELTEKYQFSMIIGLDNANTFDKWVNYEELERIARFVVVPRVGVERDVNVTWYLNKPHIFLNNKEKNNLSDISSTEIRNLFKKLKRVKNKKSVEDELLKKIDPKVFNYIIENKLYH